MSKVNDHTKMLKSENLYNGEHVCKEQLNITVTKVSKFNGYKIE